MTTQRRIPTALKPLALAGVTLVTLLAAPAARAQCAASMIHRAGSLAPAIAPSLNPVRTALAEPAREFKDDNSNGNGPGNIVGLWNITFTDLHGNVVDQGFDVWHSDGTELLNDTPPPATGNICVGVYSHTTGRGYKLYHPSWTFDSNGIVNGIAIIRENVTLDSKDASFTGTFTVDVYDFFQNHLYHLDGTVAAQRITGD